MPTPRLSFDRYRDVIDAQAEAFRDLLARPDVDLTARVPACPDWNLAQLTQHVGEELRWVDRIVRTRAGEMPDTTAFRVLDPTPTRTPADIGTWITEGAAAVVEALGDAGPDVTVWTPSANMGTTTSFFARRFAHEGLMHRVDALLAVDPAADPAVPDDLAEDGVAEWMELGALPEMLTFHPHRRELLGPGRTLRLTPTDRDEASWLVDLTGDTLVHRPARDDEPAATELRGTVVDLLLVLYSRGAREILDIRGDHALATRWLDNVEFA